MECFAHSVLSLHGPTEEAQNKAKLHNSDRIEPRHLSRGALYILNSSILMIFTLCIWEFYMHVCAPCVCRAEEGQKRALGALELELQTSVSHHGGAGPLKEVPVLLITEPVS